LKTEPQNSRQDAKAAKKDRNNEYTGPGALTLSMDACYSSLLMVCICSRIGFLGVLGALAANLGLE
jgi:hypothetical protein